MFANHTGAVSATKTSVAWLLTTRKRNQPQGYQRMLQTGDVGGWRVPHTHDIIALARYEDVVVKAVCTYSDATQL